MSTISSTSTTAWATTPATSCSGRWPANGRDLSRATDTSFASAATNSWSCSPIRPRTSQTVVATVRKLQEAIAEPVRDQGHAVPRHEQRRAATYPSDGQGRGHAAEATPTPPCIGRRRSAATISSSISPEFNERVHEKFRLQDELRSAVVRDEFVLHYQPQANLRTRRDPRRRGADPLAPSNPRAASSGSRFIPLAEEIGLIAPIGEWVLNEACRQAQGMAASRGLPPIRMSVNVSARQFREPTTDCDRRPLRSIKIAASTRNCSSSNSLRA